MQSPAQARQFVMRAHPRRPLTPKVKIIPSSVSRRFAIGLTSSGLGMASPSCLKESISWMARIPTSDTRSRISLLRIKGGQTLQSSRCLRGHRTSRAGYRPGEKRWTDSNGPQCSGGGEVKSPFGCTECRSHCGLGSQTPARSSHRPCRSRYPDSRRRSHAAHQRRGSWARVPAVKARVELCACRWRETAPGPVSRINDSFFSPNAVGTFDVQRSE